MKSHSFVYGVLMATLLYLSFGCSKKSDTDPQASAGSGTATIKLTQNGQVITQFMTTKASGLGDGQGYTLVIASPDDKHSLEMDILGLSTGTYPFINPSQTLDKGKANYLYQSYDLPAVYVGTVGVLQPDTGTVTLKTATKNRCSGSFTSTGKNAKDGKTYTLEGTFDTPVQN